MNRNRKTKQKEYLAGPPFQTDVTVFHEPLQKKRIGAVDFGQAFLRLTTLHDEIHVKVDDLIVEPVETDQRL